VKIITDVEQGSVQWLKLRLGIPTASEFHQLMTPLFKAKEGETPKTYLAKKLAEAWRGEPLPGFSSYATEQGTIREEDARPWYALEYDVDVQQVGFVLSDDERCGCSPDGLIGEDSGLEIKCPNPDTHVKYLIAEQLAGYLRCAGSRLDVRHGPQELAVCQLSPGVPETRSHNSARRGNHPQDRRYPWRVLPRVRCGDGVTTQERRSLTHP
jgi:hypothetical protein